MVVLIKEYYAFLLHLVSLNLHMAIYLLQKYCMVFGVNLISGLSQFLYENMLQSRFDHLALCQGKIN